MLSHKKIISRFNQLEKKYYYDKSFEISKNHLHLLIWNKNFVLPKFTLLRFLSNSTNSLATLLTGSFSNKLIIQLLIVSYFT